MYESTTSSDTAAEPADTAPAAADSPAPVPEETALPADVFEEAGSSGAPEGGGGAADGAAEPADPFDAAPASGGEGGSGEAGDTGGGDAAAEPADTAPAAADSPAPVPEETALPADVFEEAGSSGAPEGGGGAADGAAEPAGIPGAAADAGKESRDEGTGTAAGTETQDSSAEDPDLVTTVDTSSVPDESGTEDPDRVRNLVENAESVGRDIAETIDFAWGGENSAEVFTGQTETFTCQPEDTNPPGVPEASEAGDIGAGLGILLAVTASWIAQKMEK